MATKLTQDGVRKIEPRDTRFEVADDTITGFLLRVQPSGKKTYYANFRLASGKRTNFRIGDADVLSLAQARDKAREVLAGVELGGDPVDAKKRARECSFREFVETEYGPWAKAHNKTGAALVDVLLKAFPEFENKKMNEVSGWLIEKARKRFVEDGLKSTSSNRYLDYLRSCLSKAVEWGFLAEHPMKNVKSAREDTSHIRYLSEEERQRLMDALDAREERIRANRDSYNLWARQRGYPERPNLRRTAFADYLKPMVLLSLNTGMRRGEVFGLEWGDVNLEERSIKVRAENAKTGKARHLPMNGIVFDTLAAWRTQTAGKGLVFASPITGKRFDNVNTTWRVLLKEAKVDSFRWHDMRHDFASKLVMAGVDLYVVKELLGHSTIQMTERYAHLAPSAKVAAVKLLEAPANVVTLRQTVENGA